MLGQPAPTRIDIDTLLARLSQPANSAIVRSLEQVGITSLYDLFANYAGRRDDLQPWLADAVINRDRNLKLQYMAGLENNRSYNASIFDEFTRYRKFPEGLFSASDAWKNNLGLAAGLKR